VIHHPGSRQGRLQALHFRLRALDLVEAAVLALSGEGVGLQVGAGGRASTAHGARTRVRARGTRG
jgi:hypothetical protein